MKKSVFDILRILQIVIPGIAACYAAFARIWGWGYSTEIVGSAAALVTLLGVFLKIESANYFKQNIIVPVEDEKKGE